jgi:hypothetical protein
MEQPAAVSPGWRKSSYSGNGGAQCVEVGAVPWRTSTHSGNGGADCVEAAHAPGAILVRDTKDNGTGPVLHLTPRAWVRLTRTIRTRALH